MIGSLSLLLGSKRSHSKSGWMLYNLIDCEIVIRIGKTMIRLNCLLLFIMKMIYLIKLISIKIELIGHLIKC